MESAEKRFCPVTREIVAELRGMFGDDRVIAEDARMLERYGRDQVADPRYRHPPEVVVKPSTTAEVVDLMRLATRERIPVTPRGAGSGLSGGAVPVFGGVVLSFEAMDRVLEIDQRNMVAVVEPGVVTNRLDELLEPLGLFFAGYPLSEEFCFVGGNVAENAGGGRAVKYGVTSRYVIGLEIVTASGETMQVGGKRYKDVTGLDLLRLLTGSEGTLAVFTKIFLRLLPRPTARAMARISFDDEVRALAVVPEIVSNPTIQPSAVEFLDSVCLEETERLLGVTDAKGGKAMLFVEIDGDDAATFDRRFQTLEQLLRAGGNPDGVIAYARDAESIAALWQIRKQVPWALKRMNPHLTAEDIVVPIGESVELLKAIRGLAQRYGIAIPFFGHAGDGNYHASPMRPSDCPVEEWSDRLTELLTELYRETAALGGTISGEHGIGHKRVKYMPLVVDEAQRALLLRIKHAFDPEGILNPGKLYG